VSVAHVVLVASTTVAAIGVWAAVVRVGSLRRIVRRLRLVPAVAAADHALVAALVGQGDVLRAEPSLRALPMSVRRRVVNRLASGIEGRELERLRRIADAVGVIDSERERLRDRRWWVRMRAAALLCALAVEDAVQESLLDDGHPAVREAAIWWAGRTGLPRGLVPALLARLDDPDGMVRHAARETLVAAGPAVAEALVDTLTTASSPAGIVGVLRVAAEVHDVRVAAAALRWLGDPDAAVRAAAAAVVAQTADHDLVVHLLGDPDPVVRAAAAEGAGRSRQALLAGPVGRHLEDPAWIVRDAAAVALRWMGPSGEVVLRTAQASGRVAAGTAT
jgi:hypothetical protein